MQRDLVLRARAGDRAAFGQLAAGSIDRLYSTARLILRNGDRAEDAVQDTLLRAWLGIRGLRDPDRFDAWLRRLLVNTCYRMARRRGGPLLFALDAAESPAPESSDPQGPVADRDLLDQAFRRLSPEHRAVLVLHYYLELPDADVAESLGIPIGTMKSRLNRARAALRAAVDAGQRTGLVGRETVA